MLAYLPALATAPGQVATDTKQYLYLDPARLLRSATSLWDPAQFGGWVTHQTIGYLWPMGPFYWVLDKLGSPDWVAQRLWLGSLFLAAGAGMYVLGRVMGFGRAAAFTAAVVYQLSPYALGYANRTSVLLTPWAGLGWLLALTILAATRGGWRYPALLALVLATIGGINATAVALCGLAPVLWLLHAVASGQVTRRRAMAAAARIGGLGLLVSTWWVVALAVQSRYGAPVLTYSETIEAVSTTSSAPEVLRGLGYWLFYGSDATGRWNSASTGYLQSPGLMLVGFALVAVALVAFAVVRWRDRLFAAVLLVVGVIVAVGAHPFNDPSPLGLLIKRSSTKSTLVMALRSSTRAVPLVLLGLCLAVAAGIQALAGRRRIVASGALALLAVANLPALWNGTLVDSQLRRPEAIPRAWTDAARALDAKPHDTRVLELPGAEFAAYRWGTTTDPILPGLMDRPSITRDLLPLGGAQTMDLLYALDSRFQAGTIEVGSIAPIARLLGVGDIVVRGDMAYERFHNPDPVDVAALYSAGVPGLGSPSTFGPPIPDTPALPVVDGHALARSTSTPDPAQVTVYPVLAREPIVRVASTASTTLVSASGSGLVEAAAAGLIDGHETIQSSAALSGDRLVAAVRDASTVIVTDTNRKQASQWRGSQDTEGMTEDAGPATIGTTDTADARLPVFPHDSIAQTIAIQEGDVRAQASGYGPTDSYHPEDRAYFAVDGDPTTAWKVATHADGRGQRLRLTFDRPVDALQLVQPLDGANRWITRARITVDGRSSDIDLGDASRSPVGQRVEVNGTIVDIEILDTNVGSLASYAGQSGVGFAEVFSGVPGAPVATETVVMPTDLSAAMRRTDLSEKKLEWVMSRQRVDATRPDRHDPEPSMIRRVDAPAAVQPVINGTARLAASGAPATTDALLGNAGVTTNGSLEGVLSARGASAIDGDATTAWQSEIGRSVDASITVSAPTALSIDHLDLQLVADGRHSVPTSLTIAGGGVERTVAVPDAVDGPVGAVRPVTVSFDALTTDRLTVTVAEARTLTTFDSRSGDERILPIGIAELGIPGFPVASPATRLDVPCRSDLLTIDGTAVSLQISGMADNAVIIACGPVPQLAAGTHLVETAKGSLTGIDIDRLVLSRAGGAAPAAAAPAVTVTHNGRDAMGAMVAVSNSPTWFVLGQSLNAGWRASVDGVSLGSPQLIDGMSNGWLLPPSSSSRSVSLHWRPQRLVDAAIAISALAFLGCLVSVGVSMAGTRRRLAANVVLPCDVVAPWRAVPVIGWRGSLGAAIGVGVFAGATITPSYGLAAAVLVFVAGRWSKARLIGNVGGVVAFGAVAAYYVLRQLKDRPGAGFGWVHVFERVNRLALLAVVLVAADAALDRWRGRS